VRIALWCWMTSIQMLIAYAVPRKENIPTTVTAAASAKARFLNRSMRSRGLCTRISMMTKATSKTRATTKETMMVALPQPAVGPSITAYSSANRPRPTVTWPGMSSERPSGERESSAKNQLTAATIAARIAMMMNASRQLA
jgi:hypothetical protein